MASDPSRPEPASATPPPQPVSVRGSHLAAGASRPGRLDLGDAIHDGWQAFCRAPRVFAAYALLVNLLIILQQPLLGHIGSVTSPSRDLRDWALYGLGLAVGAGVYLWGSLGLVRGAVLALQGRRPTLGLLLQWEGTAWLRLVRAWLRLAAMVGLPLGAALFLLGLLLLLQEATPLQELLGREATRLLGLLLAALMLLSLALALVALLYLVGNQACLSQIVLLEQRGGAAAVERGRQLVDPQWPLVLLLVVVTTLLQGLGLLACAVGSLVAWPAVVCISTSAYQQLSANEQRPGLEPAAIQEGGNNDGSAGPDAADR